MLKQTPNVPGFWSINIFFSVSIYLILCLNTYCILFYSCQVEYLPCHVAVEGSGLLKEMISGLVTGLSDNDGSLKVTSVDALYKPSDTIVQVEFFVVMRW